VVEVIPRVAAAKSADEVAVARFDACVLQFFAVLDCPVSLVLTVRCCCRENLLKSVR